MFKRKVYEKLLEWKEYMAPNYACILEGARRVGKTTIAEEFAKREYETYIKIDFSKIDKTLKKVLEDINDIDLFFLELQNLMKVDLIEHKSLIIFDEIQFYPLARGEIKHLVKDARYDYLETGSLISIKKNVKNILIPSEEYKINVYPLDYEEFLWAIGASANTILKVVDYDKPIGQELNRKMMRDFRLYMAVGGMPQAVDAYIKTNNLKEVDKVKREIIELYKEDIKKLDSSGRMSDIFESIPSQLATKKNRFVITSATKKAKTNKDEERLYDLIDSKIVIPCYNVVNPNVNLSQSRDNNTFKLYLLDIGLFTTLIFDSGNGVEENIYTKLLGDKLSVDLGYMYENVAAQIIASTNRKLFYHTWKKENSTHSYEIDFLITSKNKMIPIEVKSSDTASHESINVFANKYSKNVGRRFLFSQKDYGNDGMLELKPIYSLPFILEKI